MNRNEVYALFRGIKSKKLKLEQLKAFIEEERTKAVGVSAVDYTGVAVKHSAPTNKSSENRLISYLDMIKPWEDKHNALYTDICQDREEIDKLMCILDNIEYTAIFAHYLRGLTINQTKKELARSNYHYSVDGIKDIISRAVTKMADR